MELEHAAEFLDMFDPDWLGDKKMWVQIHTDRIHALSESYSAYRYLRTILEHCAPQCEPLPDLAGTCTQIDNLIAGYRIDLGLMPDPAKRG